MNSSARDEQHGLRAVDGQPHALGVDVAGGDPDLRVCELWRPFPVANDETLVCAECRETPSHAAADLTGGAGDGDQPTGHESPVLIAR